MSDAAPAWAYEEAEVLPHDPRLADRALAERARLAELLAPWLVDGVEHVGSTAVPGLAAKPVIDLMASVADPDVTVADAGEQLAADGWCYVPPELDRGGLWRRFFVKPDASGQRRLAHLHVIRAGHRRWADQIAFRDALRRDDRLARNYEDLNGDWRRSTDAIARRIPTPRRSSSRPYSIGPPTGGDTNPISVKVRTGGTPRR